MTLPSAATTSHSSGDRLARGTRPHPRLLLDADRLMTLRRSAFEDSRMGALLRALIHGADSMLDAAPFERRLVGQYPTLLDVARRCLRDVFHLSLAFLVTREERYMDQAERQMLAVCAFSDWNPTHFLDTAEMGAALAIGYDWLYADLSESTRRTVREALVIKCLRPSFEYATEGPRSIEAGTWPVCDSNNWTQVCHAGAVLAALAVRDEEPDLADATVARAVTHLPGSMRAIYGSTGSYAEGAMYWSYGTTFNVMLIDALRTALDDTFGLETCEGFARTADYHLHMTGPTGLYFNYGDCRETPAITPVMFWFARQYGRPDLIWHESAHLHACLNAVYSETARARLASRLMPLLPVWAVSLAAEAPPAARHWLASGPNPVGVLRSGWDADATFVGLKGGSPACDHGHMDVGSFVLDALGVRWAIDLGLQEYHTLPVGIWDRHQDSDRWRVFRLSNHSHNTLVVDGSLQRVEGSAPITSFQSDGAAPHTEVELSSVYAGQLAVAHRRATLHGDGSVVMEDRLQGGPAATVVRWGMMTRAAVEGVAAGEVLLRQDGRSLLLRVTSPAGVVLQVIDTATPKAAWDAPNPGTRMVTFSVDLPAHVAHDLRVVLKPLPAGPRDRALP